MPLTKGGGGGGGGEFRTNADGLPVYVGDSATLSYLQLIRMMVEGVAGPSAFTVDPRRHRIMETTMTLPPNFRPTHLLPDKKTAQVLVNSYFVNVLLAPPDFVFQAG